jgi:hypothetical protein
VGRKSWSGDCAEDENLYLAGIRIQAVTVGRRMSSSLMGSFFADFHLLLNFIDNGNMLICASLSGCYMRNRSEAEPRISSLRPDDFTGKISHDVGHRISALELTTYGRILTDSLFYAGLIYPLTG